MSSDGRDAQRQRRFVYFPVAALKNRTAILSLGRNLLIQHQRSMHVWPAPSAAQAQAQAQRVYEAAQMQDMEDRTRQDKPAQKRGAPLLLTSPAFPRWPDHTLRLADRATTSTSARANQHTSCPPTQRAERPSPSDVANCEYDLTVTNVVNEGMNGMSQQTQKCKLKADLYSCPCPTYSKQKRPSRPTR